MREWTQPFVIQPNYVKSKTVYLFSVPGTGRRRRCPFFCQSLCSPNGQSKLFCINFLFFPFVCSATKRRSIEYFGTEIISLCIEAISMDTIFYVRRVFMPLGKSFWFYLSETSNVRAQTHSVVQPPVPLTMHTRTPIGRLVIRSFYVNILDLFKLYLFFVSWVVVLPFFFVRSVVVPADLGRKRHFPMINSIYIRS